MSDMSVFERTVSEYMSSPVCTVSADDTVEDAHKIMTEKRISCLAVVGRDGQPAGVVSRSDLLRIGRGEPPLSEVVAALCGALDVRTSFALEVIKDTTALPL